MIYALPSFTEPYFHLFRKKRELLLPFYQARQTILALPDSLNQELIFFTTFTLNLFIQLGDSCLDLKLCADKEIIDIIREKIELEDIPKDTLSQLSFSFPDLEAIVNCFTEVQSELLILFQNRYLYRHREWHMENKIINKFKKRLLFPESKYDPESILTKYFPSSADSEVDKQKLAAKIAIKFNTCLISGGPGTGKTTTVAKILAIFAEIDDKKNLRIALAAPTGKAAQRLEYSLNQFKANLSMEIQNSPLTHEVNAVQAQTIHKLLEIGSFPHKPNRHKNRPLEADIVVLDEASMISLEMWVMLLDALPIDCRLLILGDHEQLPAIKSGNIFRDITIAQISKNETEVDQANKIPTVYLVKNFRFGDKSPIARLSSFVRNGESQQAWNFLHYRQKDELLWYDLHSKKDLNDLLEKHKIIFEDYAKVESDKLQLLGNLQKSMVLSCFRHGYFGSQMINSMINQLIGNELKFMPVIIAENNYQENLFNGDLGIMDLKSDEGFFGNKIIKNRQVGKFDQAFVLTVHKSQGSEFDHLTLILPPEDYLTPFLSRELLYTAITRAKKSLTIWGSEYTLKYMVNNPTQSGSPLIRNNA